MATEQNVQNGTNQSVERAVALLRAFVDGRPEMRVGDIAKVTGIGQSTVSRQLATLEGLGLVERDDLSGTYRLGLDLLTYASVAVNQHPVHRESRQIAQDLACRLGLGANVAVLRHAQVFYLCHFEGRLAPKSYSLMGRRNPLHATALGKALLLGVAPAERAELIGPEPVRYTAHTITDPAELDAQLATGAVDGCTVEIEELALGRCCLAAPIRDAGGRVVAALSLSGPLSAMDMSRRRDELAAVAIEAADSIASGLGLVVALPRPADVPWPA
jgi:DNA-binding IclR family transcriptional regulator